MPREYSGRFADRDASTAEVMARSVAWRNALWRATAAILSMSGLAGCMTAKIEEVRDAPTRIASNEAVVLLAKPHLEGTGTEDKFLDCLERELVGESFSADHANAKKSGKDRDPRSNIKDKPFQIYADHQFVDAFYPWLEPSTAPLRPLPM